MDNVEIAMAHQDNTRNDIVAKDGVDRLSSLLPELLLVIFEKLRPVWNGTRPPTSLVPLSRSLQRFQRINLYHTINIKSEASIISLYTSLLGSGAGFLIHELNMTQPAEEEDFQAVAKAVDGLSHCLPHLRKLALLGNRLGDRFCTHITKFPLLETVGIGLVNGKDLGRLLRLEHLKKLALIFEPQERNNVEGVSLGRIGQGPRKSLERLAVCGASSPMLIEFLRSIESTSFRCVEFIDTLAALSSLTNATTHLDLLSNLGGRATTAQITLDAQLDHFSNLSHLKLGGTKLQLSANFFINLFQTSSIISITFVQDVSFNMVDLINALLPATSAPQLQLIVIEHIWTGDVEFQSVEEIETYWNERGCKLSDFTRLLELARSRGRFKLNGLPCAAHHESLKLIEQLYVEEEGTFNFAEMEGEI